VKAMKEHGIIWIIGVGMALVLGWMDYETTSWQVLFYNGGNAITLLLFMLIFASFGYGIRSFVCKKQ
jgi:hypothetical protein|tara:strand:- start:129 stop:329 length:201 start_codon:yes stop_codon:yes gene_type:complete